MHTPDSSPNSSPDPQELNNASKFHQLRPHTGGSISRSSSASGSGGSLPTPPSPATVKAEEGTPVSRLISLFERNPAFPNAFTQLNSSLSKVVSSYHPAQASSDHGESDAEDNSAHGFPIKGQEQNQQQPRKQLPFGQTSSGNQNTVLVSPGNSISAQNGMKKELADVENQASPNKLVHTPQPIKVESVASCAYGPPHMGSGYGFPTTHGFVNYSGSQQVNGRPGTSHTSPLPVTHGSRPASHGSPHPSSQSSPHPSPHNMGSNQYPHHYQVMNQEDILGGMDNVDRAEFDRYLSGANAAAVAAEAANVAAVRQQAWLQAQAAHAAAAAAQNGIMCHQARHDYRAGEGGLEHRQQQQQQQQQQAAAAAAAAAAGIAYRSPEDHYRMDYRTNSDMAYYRGYDYQQNNDASVAEYRDSPDYRQYREYTTGEDSSGATAVSYRNGSGEESYRHPAEDHRGTVGSTLFSALAVYYDT
ncbi:unnamed protein product [Meganyctiphanes norvegica]|uniref:Uncharacterized protein n=1 Tax=Meganyctiphanes norvegica TaxID=48144 RepID=A0AAV2QZX7_MEGNR